MGVDLQIIMGHKFDYKEILQLQSRIESDNELHGLNWWKMNEAVTPWDSIADAERLELSWKHNEEQKEVDEVFFFDDLYFPTFFGKIIIDRHIIKLDGFGQKLWVLENESDLRKNILAFNNRLAEILGQKKVIYFGDSWAKSSWIGNWMYGKTIKQIEEKIYSSGQGQINNIDISIKEEHLYIQK